MFRKPATALFLVFALSAARELACTPNFEFPETSASGGAMSSMGGSTMGTTTDGQAGESFGMGGEAGETQSATDVSTGGTGGRPGVPYDTGDEDCSNGVDDDQDGAADCEDEKCQPFYRCLPPVPEGWQGPIAILETQADPLPGCSGAGYYPMGLQTTGKRALSPPESSSCPSCTCEPATDASCSTVDVSYFNSPDCSGDPSVVTAGETCASASIEHDGVDLPQSAQFSPPNAGGTCQPVQTGGRSTPPVDRMRARGCGTTALGGVGCADSELCLPRPLAPFNKAVCIFTEGEVDCPAGYDTPTERYYKNESDSRSCLPCTCRSPKCTGTVEDYVDDAACSGSGTEISPDQCVSIDTDETAPNTRSFSWDTSVATCEPRSGPSGAYTLSEPLTYCCYQF